MNDISKIIATEREIAIQHPATDEPIGLTFTLLPDSHNQVRQAQRKIANERLSGKGKLSAEKIESNRMDMLFASISGWNWSGATFEGQTLEFNESNFRKVVKKLTWIADQIDKEAADRAEFFRGSEGSTL